MTLSRGRGFTTGLSLLLASALTILIFSGCQSPVISSQGPTKSPYLTHSWVLCSSPENGRSKIEVYYWNASSETLSLSIPTFAATLDSAGLSAQSYWINLKPANGVQSFTHWKNLVAASEQPDTVNLAPQDAADVEFLSPVSDFNDRPTEVQFELRDHQGARYQEEVTCPQ